MAFWLAATPKTEIRHRALLDDFGKRESQYYRMSTNRGERELKVAGNNVGVVEVYAAAAIVGGLHQWES